MDKAWLAIAAWFTTGEWVAPFTRLLLSAAIIGGALFVARIVGGGLRKLRERSRFGRPLIYIVEKLAAYGLVVAGVFIGLSTLGVNLTSLAVFAGAVGVGAGLGLQGVVREFISGLVVIFDQQVQVGDFIELENGLRGEITEVGPRASRVRTNDGVHVVIPNSKLIENQVINWTLKGGTRRIHVPFHVAYGVDKALVRDVVLKGAHAVSFTLPDTETRKTQVWMVGFGESALKFELVVWPTFEACRRPAAMQAAYTWAIEDSLRGAGIEMPLPQLDLRIRSLFGREAEAALKATGFDAQPSDKAAAREIRSTNDAADAVLADMEQEARDREDEGSRI